MLPEPKRSPSSRWDLISNPFLNSHTQQGEFRREMGFGREIKLVGIVGRIFPIKNHALFLQSAARICCSRTRSPFCHRRRRRFASTLWSNKHMSWASPIECCLPAGAMTLPRIYADLDVLVVSSDNEGTPVSAIEAMACRLPGRGDSGRRTAGSDRRPETRAFGSASGRSGARKRRS